MPGTKRQTGPKTPGKTKKAEPAPRGARSAASASKAPVSVKPGSKPAGKPAAKAATKPAARKAPVAAKPTTQTRVARRGTKPAPAAGRKPSPPPSKAAKPLTSPQLPPLRRAADLSFALNKLHQVALLATDLDRSVAFYRDVLGLHYMDRYDPPGLAFFNLGSGVRLILSATSSKATLYFLVDDIESAFRVLAQRGVSFLHGPSMIHRDDEGRLGKKGIEEWMAFFKDPSDNVLALVARR